MIQTTRRVFMGGLACVLSTPLATQAQQPAKVPRVGWLLTGSLEAPETRALLSAFRQGARERGYVEGENIVIEYRAAEGRLDRFPALAADLVRIKVRPHRCGEHVRGPCRTTSDHHHPYRRADHG